MQTPWKKLVPSVESAVYLGVMGGGQLGQMFVHAAQTMGYKTVVLDPDPNSPAGSVAHIHIHADYSDEKALAQMADLCDAVTVEFENVPASALAYLLAHAVQVSPSHQSVLTAQNRIAEKNHFKACGIPTAPFVAIEAELDLLKVAESIFPAILKTASMGYDGKGQIRVKDHAQLKEAWGKLKQVPCVLEKMLSLQGECSVIVARGFDGTMVHLPVQHNIHQDGVLALTQVFSDAIPTHMGETAIREAKHVAENLNYVGVLCVEFFLLDIETEVGRELGGLVVNEIAPRPHNSGHYSIEAVDTNQFELQVRTLAGLALTPVRQHSPAAMINLLGDLWWTTGVYQAPPWDRLLARPGCALHLYGKNEAKKGRKMGHITLTANTTEEVKASCAWVANELGIKLTAQDGVGS